MLRSLSQNVTNSYRIESSQRRPLAQPKAAAAAAANGTSAPRTATGFRHRPAADMPQHQQLVIYSLEQSLPKTIIMY